MRAKLIPVGFIALCFGIYFIILLPYDYLYFSVLPTYSIFGDASIIVANVILEIVLIVLFCLLVYLLKKTPPLKLWNKAQIGVLSCVLAFFTGVASGLFTICLFKLPYTLDHFPECNQLLVTFFGQGVFAWFALFCITSSVFKEVLFRGIVMNELRAIIPVTAAIILQALLYGVANFYSQGIVAIVFGALGAVVFGLLYFWSKNIFISIIAQVGDIATIILLTMLKDSVINRTTACYALAPSIIGLVAFGFYFYRLHKKGKKAAVEKEQSEIQDEMMQAEKQDEKASAAIRE